MREDCCQGRHLSIYSKLTQNTAVWPDDRLKRCPISAQNISHSGFYLKSYVFKIPKKSPNVHIYWVAKHCIICFFKWANPGLFLSIFVLWTLLNSINRWKCIWCAWDSITGRQDGRRRRIHLHHLLIAISWSSLRRRARCRVSVGSSGMLFSFAVN